MSREAQQELLEAFSNYVSPQKVAAIASLGGFIPAAARECGSGSQTKVDRLPNGRRRLHSDIATCDHGGSGKSEADMGDHMLASGTCAAKRLAELTPATFSTPRWRQRRRGRRLRHQAGARLHRPVRRNLGAERLPRAHRISTGRHRRLR
jgi:hypothetical protein